MASAKNDPKHEQRKSPKNRWKKDVKPDPVGTENLRVFAITFKDKGKKGGGKKIHLSLDDVVESLNWDDSTELITGTVVFRRPTDEGFHFDHGDLIVAELRETARDKSWRELWRMRAESSDGGLKEGSYTFNLVSPLSWLARSKDDWKFRKEKKGAHKKGWQAHEITKEVCKRYNVKVGKLAKPKKEIRSLVKTNTSPMDIIKSAYKSARDPEMIGDYVIEFRNNELNVRPLRYSKFMWVFEDEIADAAIHRALQPDFATSLTVKATADEKKTKDKKGKGKIEVTVEQKDAIKRYGLIHRTITADQEIDTPAKAKEEGRRELHDVAKRDRTLSASAPGVPRLQRGDAIKVKMPQFGINRICFARSVTHSVSVGNFDTTVELEFEDEIADLKKCLEKCRKAQKKDRPEPEECDCPAVEKKDHKKGDDKKDQRS